MLLRSSHAPRRRRTELPFLAPAAAHAAQSCLAAILEDGQQLVELAAAQIRIALGGELANGPRDDPADDLGRKIGMRKSNGSVAFTHRMTPLVVGRPVERGIS